MIVKSTISMSGTVLTPNEGWQSQDYSHSNFTFAARKYTRLTLSANDTNVDLDQLGCRGSNEALLACMRKKPASSISKIAFNNSTGVTFLPLADDTLVFADYSKRLIEGQFSKLVIIPHTYVLSRSLY